MTKTKKSMIMIRGHDWPNTLSSQLISTPSQLGWLHLIHRRLKQSLKILIPTPILTRRNIPISNKPIFYE